MSTNPHRTALAGLAALAVAIGVGRFAFTPLFPLMQDESGLTTAQGAWLASANYVGYLAGALAAVGASLRPAAAIRAGLVLVALSTLAMGLCDAFVAWLVLRAVAGAASAWILVFASAWALERLAGRGNALARGLVFAGVGAGITAAGLGVIAVMHLGANAPHGWALLGLGALVMSVLVWRSFGRETRRIPAPRPRSPATLPSRLVAAYGAFGFGYIIPATFLPVMAKQLLGNGASFEWVWPVFGFAAAASTLVSARLPARVTTLNVWIGGHVVMAAGMLLPVLHPGIASVMAAALLVGCTFMVITVAGLQRAREVAGDRATPLIAAMTSAFAVGQILGPLAAAQLLGRDGDFSIALSFASATMLLAACALLKPGKARHEALSEQSLAVRSTRDGRCA